MKPSTRKFHNEFKCSIYGLHLSMVKKYFQNNKNYLEYGKFLKSNGMVTKIIKCGTRYIADVMDFNNNNIEYSVIIDLFQEPVKSELDIHPVNTQCNCSTYIMDKHKKATRNIKEIMCGDIAAILLSLIDGGDTTSPFVTSAIFLTKQLQHSQVLLIDDIPFKSNELHSLCPHPSEIFNDLDQAHVLCGEKYTCMFLLSYATSIRTKKPVCAFCYGAGKADMKEFAWKHKCPMYNPNNINPFTNKSTSFLTFSVFFQDVHLTKSMQIILKLAQYEYEPFCRLARNNAYSASLISIVFHRVATVCDIAMENTPQFGRKEHPNIEADAGKCGMRYHGQISNPHAYEQSWAQTTINRDVTHKGKKPMISQMGGAESIASYGNYMVKTWAKGANVNTDEHTLYRSNFVKNKWRRSGAHHKSKQWVDPDTMHWPGYLKAHDNNAEQIMNYFKLQRRIRKGMGLVNNGQDIQRHDWHRMINWRNCFTDGTPKDFLVTFFQHLSLILKWQMHWLLMENGWKEK